ncbi:Protein NUCLEAR FUSION DEFECTIVE 4 [Linum perenne]
MAPITGSLFLLLNESHTALYISTAVIGICTGAITSIAVSVTSELFGSQNFAVNHNIVVANIPVGSFCFGYLAAQVYESETLPGQLKCMGMVCYHRTFVVWGQLSGFGVLLGFILYNRTKEFYSKRLIALNSFV